MTCSIKLGSGAYQEEEEERGTPKNTEHLSNSQKKHYRVPPIPSHTIPDTTPGGLRTSSKDEDQKKLDTAFDR